MYRPIGCSEVNKAAEVLRPEKSLSELIHKIQFNVSYPVENSSMKKFRYHIRNSNILISDRKFNKK